MIHFVDRRREEPTGCGGGWQPSMDGTSRVTGDCCHARFCERLGMQFPGARRHPEIAVPTAIAIDTKLGRDVAIKTLPEKFAQDPNHMARFEREAKLLAGLNHPNIAAIYGVEDRASSWSWSSGPRSRTTLRKARWRGRSAADRQANSRGAGLRARTRRDSSRSETRKRESEGRRDIEGARLLAGKSLNC